MVQVEMRLDLPAEVVELLGTTQETSEANAKQAIVLDLLRKGRIGQGKAAQVLGVTRWDILDLMVENHIPSGPESPQEAHEEMARLEQALGAAHGE